MLKSKTYAIYAYTYFGSWVDYVVISLAVYTSFLIFFNTREVAVNEGVICQLHFLVILEKFHLKFFLESFRRRIKKRVAVISDGVKKAGLGLSFLILQFLFKFNIKR